ncbi:DNA polymerase III subunit alpha [Suttonella ornithocola]|uniref:DNA polymerase III subunit alpha n=1 Tax=Suttonella ornithocola TaxID=279832 RepID=A0A380N037_9GAMM|nr:DNA polymerase III subunit alpha [Suttonella ornithocola]SUO97107.1 DNA polymerase III subunit alpha [Suttonella ornithocola]
MLHIHSEYSLIDSILRVGDIVAYAKNEGLESLALTDKNNTYGLLKFYKKARAAGIKPILGCDLSIRRKDGSIHQLVLLAMNAEGFKRLNELVSFAYEYDQLPGELAVNQERLTETQCEGLIALSGAMEGDIASAVISGDNEAAFEYAKHWQSIFKDRFYLQIARHGVPHEQTYIEVCQKIGAQLGIAALATNLACFSTASQYDVHEARVCISSGRVMDDPTRPKRYTENHYLRSQAELAEVFSDAPILLENAKTVAMRCNVTLDIGNNYLPDFPLPEGVAIEQYLVSESEKGLEQRLIELFPNEEERLEKAPEYRERLKIELGVINQMGFPGYFLIVADFIQWAKDNDVPVGPGRGSGAGSLVAFALEITDLDPLAYDLLFERFLNPERVSMPDFDVDFCMEKRDKVIRYVADKYGHEKVSQIATHGTMAAKAVIRDVGRVMGLPYPVCDRISKLVPKALGVTLSDALGRTEKSKSKPEFFSEDLLQAYESDEETKTLIDIALQLEGLARNVGKHAGGVVIAPTRLTDFSALYCESAGSGLVTQFDKDDIEAAGLVKFDFLGLRTLTVIDWALANVNRSRAREGKPPLIMREIPLDDKVTFDLLKSTKTSAVFQLESSGMKGLIKKLQPDNFEDIIALVALFRPGPLGSGMVDDFINRKHGLAEVSYPHPALAPILENTYGVMVYQEQVMQVAQVLANYSLGEADLLRRAMGKKKAEVMVEQKAIFVERAVAGGVEPQVANDIFDLMAKFAEYGFNKSHSAAYALLSYHTAWLKAHYPAELMAAVLSSDLDKIDKVVPMVDEALDMGLTIRPPCVNASAYEFTVNAAGEIVYGLGAVKGVGHAAVGQLLAEREQNGPYTSMLDLCRRLDLKKINKNNLEMLIAAGAFDQIEANRGALMAALPKAIELANQHHKIKSSKQADMFGLLSEDASQADEAMLKIDSHQRWSQKEKLMREKEAFGMYLTDHPVNSVRSVLSAICGQTLAELQESMLQWEVPRKRGEGRKVVVGGLMVDLRTILTKQNKKMAFLMLDDRSGRMEVTIFSELLEQAKTLLESDKGEETLLLIEAKAEYSFYKQEWQLTAESIYNLEEEQYHRARGISIRAKDSHITHETLQLLQNLRQVERGVAIYLHLQCQDIQSAGKMTLGGHYRLDEKSLRDLRQTFGHQSVNLLY